MGMSMPVPHGSLMLMSALCFLMGMPVPVMKMTLSRLLILIIAHFNTPSYGFQSAVIHKPAVPQQLSPALSEDFTAF
jgi:hypothetical protein